MRTSLIDLLYREVMGTHPESFATVPFTHCLISLEVGMRERDNLVKMTTMSQRHTRDD